MKLPLLLKTKNEVDEWKKSITGSVGFVPTMGSLHAGHVFLASEAKKQNDHTVVSIFVNPKQFAQGEDLEAYPRTLEADLRAVRGAADVVFAPSAATVYAPNFATHLSSGNLGKELCGEYRPPHFDGVVTVVFLLLQLVEPTTLYLGKKDYQQLTIVKQMVKDLFLAVKVVGVETQRNANGLALSSRNQYLNADQLKEAGHIRTCLLALKDRMKEGQDAHSASRRLFEDLSKSPNIKPQYAELRLRTNLKEPKKTQPGAMVALVAAFLGKARLIDNIEI